MFGNTIKKVLGLTVSAAIMSFCVPFSVSADDQEEISYVNSGGNADGGNDTTDEEACIAECVPSHRNLNYKYEKGGTGFKDRMGPYFRLGTSVSSLEISSPTAQEFIKKNYNSITCENELKPDSIVKAVIGDDVIISLDNASAILKFAEENDIGVRGHTFVWYSQTPKSLFQDDGSYVSKERMNDRLESMIKNTFSQLKSQFPDLQIHSYDVCNELFVDDGGGMRSANNSNWAKIYGEGNSEFVLNAFKYARHYAPWDCKLYLSDYNEYMSDKTQDIVNMVKSIMKEGDYIDGIGMQAHLDSSYPSASEFETAIKKFEALGLDVQITELDITNSTGTNDKLYPQIFEVATKHANHISCVTLGATSDERSWRYRENGGSPLPFSNYQPKSFYYDIITLAKKEDPEPVTSTAIITTTSSAATTNKPAIKTTSITTTNTAATTVDSVDLKEDINSKVNIWGDANCDSSIDMSDAVLIMQSLANPNKYQLTDLGMNNADVYENGGGITTNDAVAIQKYLLGLIKSLPESYSSNVTATTTTTPKAFTTTTTVNNEGKHDVENDTTYKGVAAHQNLNYKYESGGDGFKDYMGPYFRLGTGVGGYEINNSVAQEFIKKNYNSVTCMNEMKPDSIIKSVNGDEVEISLNSANNILKFAEENGIGVRGHTFVWYSQTPTYFFQDNHEYVSKERMNKRLESMIKNTFAQIKSDYPDLQLHSYDVCNELFVNDGGEMRPANNSNWVRVYGEGNSEFVVNAFKYAREYAPEDCKLYLSDYNEYISAKTQDLVNMAKTIMKEGDYIDGIGMQAHLDTNYPSVQQFETAIKEFEALGLDIQITELDITNSDGTNGQLYPQIFEVAMKHAKNISCVSLSRTTDESIWRFDDRTRLPFSNYKPKSFYYDIIALADKIAPPTPSSAITTTTITTTTQTTTTTKAATTTTAVNYGEQ